MSTTISDNGLLRAVYGAAYKYSNKNTETNTKKAKKDIPECDAPCPICGCDDLFCMKYDCGIVVLVCPHYEAKGTGCSIGGAYSNLKTSNKEYDDKDTRSKIALESIAESLKIIVRKFQEAEHD